MKSIKKLMRYIWVCRSHIAIMWFVFFILSLLSHSPYSIFKLFLISGAWSFCFFFFILIARKYKKFFVN